MVNSNYTNITGSAPTPISYYEPSESIKHQMEKDHDRLVKSNVINRSKASLHKVGQAFTTYPAKGLKGDQNSSFYEFLAMGIIPTIVGSLTMIGLFNGVNNKFSQSSKQEASKIGKKFAVGVVGYLLAKEIAKKVVNKPVQAATGVDLDQPYIKVVREIPPNGYEQGKIRLEYHKAFESSDFPRWDLFHDQGIEHGNRNEYFDKIAKRNGYGTLNASDQEMKPKIRELMIKAKTWSTVLGYTFAATAVGLAAQTPWEELLNNKGQKRGIVGSVKHIASMTGRSFKEMWKGGAKKTKASGIVGKTLLIASAAGAIIAPIATVAGFRKKANTPQTIDESKRYYNA
ncbi:MAG: hypothetical protein PHE78_03515 [Candidatus Gastranaerophilales bacterium]|nr:hypothetical protein [Candidatus Gastranaerophilales bacterium]